MLSVIYVLALLSYLYTFILFLRIFVWRRLAWRNFWRKKVSFTLEELEHIAKISGSSLPFFTIMVPARNESLVIARTIENLMKIQYPRANLEIIVVTDEKERQDHDRVKPIVTDELLKILANPDFEPKETDTRRFFLAYVVTKLSLGQLLFASSRIKSRFPRERLSSKLQRLIFQLSNDFLSGKPTDVSTVFYGLRKSLPGVPDDELSELVEEILLLVRLALLKVTQLFKVIGNPVNQVERVAESFRVLPTLRTENNRLAELDKALWGGKPYTFDELQELYDSFFLTTQEVVEDCIKNLDDFRLKNVEVPFDFDGSFGGICTGKQVKSTKGRALNYAFSQVDPQTSMVVFYDAESHPDHDVLVHAARHLMTKNPPQILQGPLFQVRNYYRMGILSRIGGLYKAISHDWYLPLMFSRLPFVGGTNLFISWDLINKMRGFDENTLTEDLEFGCRAYLYFGTKLTFLPVKSTEQTPPTVAQYFRQRLRWGSGHLEVMRKVRRFPYTSAAFGTQRDFKTRAKQLFWNLLWMGPFDWITYQLSTIIVLVMNGILVANAFGAGIPGPFFLENPIIRWALISLNVPYMAFTIYCYARYDEVFDKTFKPVSSFLGILDIMKLVIATFVVFMLPAPYTWAVILAATGHAPTSWVKTPRTSE